ncbi:MAG: hypothetical protein LBM78_04755, partial [Clostridiales bacterium]|nr:hypothetical protein [Clostridiales bacterium]
KKLGVTAIVVKDVTEELLAGKNAVPKLVKVVDKHLKKKRVIVIETASDAVIATLTEAQPLLQYRLVSAAVEGCPVEATKNNESIKYWATTDLLTSSAVVTDTVDLTAEPPVATSEVVETIEDGAALPYIAALKELPVEVLSVGFEGIETDHVAFINALYEKLQPIFDLPPKPVPEQEQA